MGLSEIHDHIKLLEKRFHDLTNRHQAALCFLEVAKDYADPELKAAIELFLESESKRERDTKPDTGGEG